METLDISWNDPVKCILHQTSRMRRKGVERTMLIDFCTSTCSSRAVESFERKEPELEAVSIGLPQ